MEIAASASIVVPRAREEVFEFSCRNDTYERNLGPYGPIAGIQKSELHEGHVLETGANRRISLTDGSVLEETILDHIPPARHRYRWTRGLKPPLSILVRSGTGCWDFSDVTGGTRIDWKYAFELRSPTAYPLVLLLVPLFERWQNKGLKAIRAELVSDRTHSWPSERR